MFCYSSGSRHRALRNAVVLQEPMEGVQNSCALMPGRVRKTARMNGAPHRKACSTLMSWLPCRTNAAGLRRSMPQYDAKWATSESPAAYRCAHDADVGGAAGSAELAGGSNATSTSPITARTGSPSCAAWRIGCSGGTSEPGATKCGSTGGGDSGGGGAGARGGSRGAEWRKWPCMAACDPYGSKAGSADGCMYAAWGAGGECGSGASSGGGGGGARSRGGCAMPPGGAPRCRMSALECLHSVLTLRACHVSIP